MLSVLFPLQSIRHVSAGTGTGLAAPLVVLGPLTAWRGQRLTAREADAKGPSFRGLAQVPRRQAVFQAVDANAGLGRSSAAQQQISFQVSPSCAI